MARLGAGVRKRKNGTLEKRFTIKGVRYSVYGLNNKELTEKEQAIRKELDALWDMMREWNWGALSPSEEVVVCPYKESSSN